MSTPGQSNPSGDNPYQPEPKDPFAAGQQGGYPGQQGGQPGYPSQQGGYPGPQGGQPGQGGGYPGQQPGYPSQQGGYPGPQGGQPGQGGGYPSQQGGYPGQQGGYPGQQGGYPGYPGQQGGYPGPQGGYGAPGGYPGGAYPAPGGGYGGALPPEPVRPNTVTYAFYCWLATAVVSIIGLILTLTSPIWDLAVNAATRQNNVSLQGTSVQSLINTLKIFTVVIALIFVAVYLLFAFKMYAGRNWARIVLTVFGALTLLSAFTPTSRSVTVGSEVYNINTGAWAGYVTALLALIGIVLMFLAPSNKYFAESKTYKQAKQQIRA